MGKLAVYEKQMLASPDKQIALTDPDSRSMATSGRGSGVVGYNVQVAVDTEHHLIVTHEVTNSGSDRAQLANMAKQAKGVLKTETLEAVADRGYFSSPEILACHEAGITVTLPKPQTSGAKSDGRFGKQDFVYLPEEDSYRCPAGEQLPYRFTSEEDWKVAPRYIIRDRDAVYGDVFIRRLRAMGIRDRPTAPRSPWQNGYCERAIGSIRRECLDHVVVFGERHLRHLLRSYATYYNEARTHLSVHN